MVFYMCVKNHDDTLKNRVLTSENFAILFSHQKGVMGSSKEYKTLLIAPKIVSFSFINGRYFMFDKEKFQTEILNVEVPEYKDITTEEIMAIYELGNDPFNLITNGFLCGMMKAGKSA